MEAFLLAPRGMAPSVCGKPPRATRNRFWWAMRARCDCEYTYRVNYWVAGISRAAFSGSILQILSSHYASSENLKCWHRIGLILRTSRSGCPFNSHSVFFHETCSLVAMSFVGVNMDNWLVCESCVVEMCYTWIRDATGQFVFVLRWIPDSLAH